MLFLQKIVKIRYHMKESLNKNKFRSAPFSSDDFLATKFRPKFFRIRPVKTVLESIGKEII
jgi:hypothetical protein